MLIRNLAGQVEHLTDYDVTRKATINAEKTIDVTVYLTSRNAHSFPMINYECTFIYDSEEYVIKQFKTKPLGKSLIATASATHIAYNALGLMHIYDTKTGTFSADNLLKFSLAGTGFSYDLDTTGLETSVEVENFGDDDSLSLLQSICDKFSCEYMPVGKTIKVAKELGQHTDNQIRYLFNAKGPEQSIDTTALRTYIKGFGKQNEDGSYVVTAEYTSPLAGVLGIRHADPVRDERFTQKDSLLAYMKSQLDDTIHLSLTITYVQAKDAGIQDIELGDYLWCIIEPFGLKTEIRVSEIEDYSNESKSPVLTFGEIERTFNQSNVILRSSSSNITKIGAEATEALNTASMAYNARILTEKVGDVND